MNNESQFIYQLNILCVVEPDDYMGDYNDDENVGGEDTDMQAQPSYPNFSSYFMIDKVYFIRLLFVCILCFVIE